MTTVAGAAPAENLQGSASSDEILIMGAGIAGLGAAIALSLDGHPVTVLERSEELKEFGAGVQLGPHAVRILQRWGIAELLRPHISAPTGVAVHDGKTSALITRIPLGRTIEKRHGAPYWVVHRADLQNALLKRLKTFSTAKIRLGFNYDLYKRVNDHVTVLPEEGKPLHGRVLIGADGLRSQVRRQVTGRDPDPEFSGKTAWRALIDTASLPDGLWRSYTGLWMAPNAHFVHYPINGNRQLNIVAIIDDEWQDEVWAAPGNPKEVMSHFTRWAAEPRKLLSLPEKWMKWPLFRQPRGVIWPMSAGPVLLIGDASHPVLPFLAQGAAMAIEDAAAFALYLRQARGDVRMTVGMFEAARRPRVRRVQRTSEKMGRIYHLPAPLNLARNRVMQHRGREQLLASLDWLYGHDVEEVGATQPPVPARRPG